MFFSFWSLPVCGKRLTECPLGNFGIILLGYCFLTRYFIHTCDISATYNGNVANTAPILNPTMSRPTDICVTVFAVANNAQLTKNGIEHPNNTFLSPMRSHRSHDNIGPNIAPMLINEPIHDCWSLDIGYGSGLSSVQLSPANFGNTGDVHVNVCPTLAAAKLTGK